MLYPLELLRRTMPNYRTETMRIGDNTFRVKARPKGWRQLPLMGWIPYATGSKVAVSVEVKLEKGAGSAEPIFYSLRSDIQNRRLVVIDG